VQPLFKGGGDVGGGGGCNFARIIFQVLFDVKALLESLAIDLISPNTQ
jgi:hypothetical protein